MLLLGKDFRMGSTLLFIKSMDLFCDFNDDELEKLIASNQFNIKKLKSESILHLQNEICDYLEIIVSGKIQVQNIDACGDMLVISDFYSGESIGDNLLFSTNNFYPMTMIAKGNTKLIQIHKSMVLDLCKSNEKFLLTFLQSVSTKTLLLAGKIKTLSMKTIRQCIAEYLIHEYYSSNNKRIILTMTKKDLAERFGIPRPSLSRELNRMRTDGLIIFDAGSITIIDVDNLLLTLK